MNRWLSPELRDISVTRTDELPRLPKLQKRTRSAGPQSDPGAAQIESTSPLRSNEFARAAGRDRREWARTFCLRTAAIALLCGSAAFSYVAWSKGVNATNKGLMEQAAVAKQSTSAAYPTDVAPLAPQPALHERVATRQQIHHLRESNHALRVRLAELQESLELRTQDASDGLVAQRP
jgi:hypothetical protein